MNSEVSCSIFLFLILTRANSAYICKLVNNTQISEEEFSTSKSRHQILLDKVSKASINDWPYTTPLQSGEMGSTCKFTNLGYFIRLVPRSYTTPSWWHLDSILEVSLEN